jgi:hypothetical protein
MINRYLKQQEPKQSSLNNSDFNDFLYGVYLSGGYNTINLYAYYGLNPLFKSGSGKWSASRF